MIRLLALLILLSTRLPAQSPDLILTNGKIFTADSTTPYVDALAIKGDKILAVGSNQTIQKLAGVNTKQIDLTGKTVVPGFNDAHDHLGWLVPVGQSFQTPFSEQGLSKKALLDSLTKLVNRASPGQWIQGTIGLTILMDTTVRRRYLDSIAPHNPLVLQVPWGHGMLVNTPVLKAIHVSDTAADPLGGWYERVKGSRSLTGAFYEYAQFPVWQALVLSEPVNLISALKEHARQQLALGITTVQNMSSTLQGEAARKIFKEAALPLRTRIIPMPSTSAQGRNLGEWNHQDAQLTPLTYVSGIKYMMDGTPIEQAALMSKPYAIRSRINWYGRLNFPLDTIRQILQEALTSSRQLMLHCVGDSTTQVVLGLMKELAPADQWKRKRVRLEHGGGIRTASAAALVRELGIVIDHTPQYGLRSSLRTWLQMGIRVAIGPDALMNPYVNLRLVTTQQANPAENITRQQAVMAYTVGSAYAEFAEGYKGTLMAGKLADLVVLSQDIFTIPAQQLPATRSVLTLVGGKIVYP
jgi:predicted amidohydrolase YtcJ